MYTQAELLNLDRKDFRDAYVDEHVRITVAFQLRSIREAKGLTQREFAEILERPPSVISRLENTEYGKVTVQTLLDIARKLDVALVVKFATYPEFLLAYQDLSSKNLAVEGYEITKNKLRDYETVSVSLPTSAPQEFANVYASTVNYLSVSEPTYRPTEIVESYNSMFIRGYVVAPFVLIQITTVPGESQHG